jgi:hypothetical protein
VRTAYVTTWDPSDIRAWSGHGYHMARCLEFAGITVQRIGPLAPACPSAGPRPSARGKAIGPGYPLDRDPHVARAYAVEVDRRLKSVRCDLAFSPASIPIAYLEAAPPLANVDRNDFRRDAPFLSRLQVAHVRRSAV